jgi:hypothetical protein
MVHRTTRGTSGLSRTPRSCYLTGEMLGASHSLRTGFFLTRKRSQVQTLSRPPPFLQVTALPESTQSRSLPARAAPGPRAILAAELIGHARPVHSHVRAPQRLRRVVAAPAPVGRPHGAVPQHRASQLPCPTAVASDRAPAWRSGLTWSVGCSLPPKHPSPGQSAADVPAAGLHTTSAAVPASKPPRAVCLNRPGFGGGSVYTLEGSGAGVGSGL